MVGSACEGQVYGGRNGGALNREAVVCVAILVGRESCAVDVTLDGDSAKSVGAIGEVVEGCLYGALSVLAADVVGAWRYEAGDAVEEVYVVGFEYPAVCFECLEGLGKGDGVLLHFHGLGLGTSLLSLCTPLLLAFATARLSKCGGAEEKPCGPNEE